MAVAIGIADTDAEGRGALGFGGERDHFEMITAIEEQAGIEATARCISS